jgi:hypothetical protein
VCDFEADYIGSGSGPVVGFSEYVCEFQDVTRKVNCFQKPSGCELLRKEDDAYLVGTRGGLYAMGTKARDEHLRLNYARCHVCGSFCGCGIEGTLPNVSHGS